jgi:hypothetical protein
MELKLNIIILPVSKFIYYVSNKKKKNGEMSFESGNTFYPMFSEYLKRLKKAF